MDLLPCGSGLRNTGGQDILGSTHPVVILLSGPQARVVNIIPPILLYKFQTTCRPLLSDLAQMGRQTQGISAPCAKALMFPDLPSGSTANSGPRGQTQG